MFREYIVAATDLLIALQCVLFCLALREGGQVLLRRWFIIFFAVIAVASLLGAVVHAFIPDESTKLYAVAWRATLLTVGAAGVAAWMLGAHLWMRESSARMLGIVVAVSFLAYLVVIAYKTSFAVAIAYYLPSTVFLLLSFAMVPGAARWLGVVGMLLTLAAAFIQKSRIALHPEYFDHNSLYHTVQFISLLLIYLAARRLLMPVPPVSG